LLERLVIVEPEEKIVLIFLAMLEKICNRVAYLVLLVENPSV